LKPSKKAIADLARVARTDHAEECKQSQLRCGVKETPVFFIAAFYQN
jgi:hypothetical protein